MITHLYNNNFVAQTIPYVITVCDSVSNAENLTNSFKIFSHDRNYKRCLGRFPSGLGYRIS